MYRLLFISLFIISGFFVKGQSILDINASNVVSYLASGNVNLINNDIRSFVIQEGNHNNADIFLIDDKIITVQLGNNNSIFYQDGQALQSSIMSLNVKGDNNLVEVIGSNSISNGMSIDIIGNDKVVLIENR